MVGDRYVELFSEADLAILHRVAEASPAFSRIGIGRMLSDPELLEYFLSSDVLYEELFGREGEVFVHASPFLGFAVLIHRCARAIADATYLSEWVGPRSRVPLFDTGQTKALLGDREARLFLAELLASFTHVSSGVVLERDRQRLKKRRFSELDLPSLVDLAARSPAPVHAHVLKRAGDLALLLAGVFPDYAGTMLRRSMRFRTAVVRALATATKQGEQGGSAAVLEYDALGDDVRGLEVLEKVVASCYRAAVGDTIEAGGGEAPVASSTLRKIAEDARPARRALNFLTDRYLYAYRSSWFGTTN